MLSRQRQRRKGRASAPRTGWANALPWLARGISTPDSTNSRLRPLWRGCGRSKADGRQHWSSLSRSTIGSPRGSSTQCSKMPECCWTSFQSNEIGGFARRLRIAPQCGGSSRCCFTRSGRAGCLKAGEHCSTISPSAVGRSRPYTLPSPACLRHTNRSRTCQPSACR
jgi:hypothetical protein